MYDSELFYIERLYNYYSKYTDTAVICKLTADGFGDSVIIQLLPSIFEYEKIYSIYFPAEQAITEYVDSIIKDLMSKSQIDDSIEVFIGEESSEFNDNKLLRLQSVGGDRDYYEIDYNNDGIMEYLSKYYWFPSNYLALELLNEEYLFTDTRIVSRGQNFYDTERLLIQLWFKEIEGIVYTFRLFLNDGYNYVLNASLIDGVDITQLQSYIIVPKKEFHIQTGERKASWNVVRFGYL